ncbi:MAG TPA: branched-chain amino acid ABC transporter permease [Actinomycetales bacterium]|jgi:branched-chain amino acid transport system permease protein
MRYVSLAISGLTLGSIYALVALGFHLVFRTAGIIDFAQGEKVVVAGLVALSLIGAGVPLPIALLLVLIGGLVAGVLYDYVVIRPTQRNGPTAAVIATVGASLILGSGHAIIWGSGQTPFPRLTEGSFGLGSIEVEYQSLWIWGILAVIVASLIYLMRRTRAGKGMVAAASDPLAATTVGINVRRTRITAFAIATALAAVAGVLVAPLTLAGGAIGGTLTIKGFTAAILGGIGSTRGVVLGGLLLGVLENVVGGSLPNGLRDPFVFAALLVILLVAPTGLFGGRRGRLA